MDVVARTLAAVRSSSAPAFSAERQDRIARYLFDALVLGVVGRQTREFAATRQALCLNAASTRDLSAWSSRGDLRIAAATAAAVRLSEADDIHLPSCTTPGSVVVPAALFALDHHGAVPADRLMRGILAGYQVIGALGEWLGGPRQISDGVWPSYLLAPVGAAVTVGTILDFDEELLVHAIASAFSVAKTPYSIRPGSGLGSRWLAYGLAVASGIAAAEGAAAGLRSDLSIPDRLFASGQFGRLDDALGDSVESVFDRTSIKPFSSGRQSLSALQAFAALLADHELPVESIKQIVVSVPAEFVGFIDRRPPFSDRRATLGVQYQLALQMLYADDLYDIERGAARPDPRIDAIASAVRVQPSDRLSAAYPRHWGAEVTIHAGSGVRSKTVVVAKGDPEDAFDWDDAVDKARRLTVRQGLSGHDVVEPALGWARMLGAAPLDQAVVGVS